MRYIFQQFFICLAALFVCTSLFAGLTIRGGLIQYMYDAVLLVIGFVIVKPILNIIALPFNALTLGVFSIFSTVAVLFLLALSDRNFIIQPFLFNGISFYGFSIPSFHLNIFLSYLLISVTIQVVYKFLIYLFDL